MVARIPAARIRPAALSPLVMCSISGVQRLVPRLDPPRPAAHLRRERAVAALRHQHRLVGAGHVHALVQPGPVAGDPALLQRLQRGLHLAHRVARPGEHVIRSSSSPPSASPSPLRRSKGRAPPPPASPIFCVPVIPARDGEHVRPHRRPVLPPRAAGIVDHQHLRPPLPSSSRQHIPSGWSSPPSTSCGSSISLSSWSRRDHRVRLELHRALPAEDGGRRAHAHGRPRHHQQVVAVAVISRTPSPCRSSTCFR